MKNADNKTMHKEGKVAYLENANDLLQVELKSKSFMIMTTLYLLT